MEKQLFQFGDEETTDVKLQMISEDASEEINVYLHSRVLRKSEFYEDWLSNRWSLDEQPRELKIRSSVSSEIYLRSFQLMYSCEADEGFCFSGVDEALDVLPLVSQMLFHEGIEQCMIYLEGVRWSPDQETKLRAMLSSLQINILPELAARIGMINILPELAARIGMSPHKSDPGNLDLAARIGMRPHKSDSGNLDLAARIGMIFCENDYLRDSVRYSRVGVNFKVDILLEWILNAMSNGEIIMPATFRVSFLTNWLYLMALLIFKHPSKREKLWALEKGIMNVGDTLPLHAQKFIYNFWKDSFERLSVDSSNALKWWAHKVQDAIMNGII